MILIFLFHIKKFHLSHTAGCMTSFFIGRIVKVPKVHALCMQRPYSCALEKIGLGGLFLLYHGVINKNVYSLTDRLLQPYFPLYREQVVGLFLATLPFYCGRRPASHVMMAVVVIAVVVVIVVGGGGEQLLYMGSPRAHVWSQRFQKQNPIIF